MDELDLDETFKLDNQLCFALYTASRAIIDVYRPVLNELGITYPQYLVLLALWEQDHRSVKDIGNVLRLDSGTLSPLLKRLEAAGFIKRQRRAEDERVVDINLTDKGRALKQRAVKVPQSLACVLNLATPEEYISLLTLLKKLNQILASLNQA
ncbi:MarR family transcriptional regulator [Ktedonosporobacter rubrisoli]|uniref:MarR family transcriptional regulator n=1 Tax=Ktedonosporobacter rubrisoli TaxID=2509675 RepID=A0A4P6JWA2_KTERU|nr:MarR family transcriptional regulator [Ktedonosporobacter rubrisoli]QBD79844.1 MarR family transcriptional regulator [Ktedonosporobacter rubrisoli]